MRIRVEPKELFMYSVFLAFNPDRPDSEDEAVKAYLDQHELIPKMQGKDTVDGQEYDVMYFGGCYLGRHLEVVGDMQRMAVEKDMLDTEIERLLKNPIYPAIRDAAEKAAGPQWQELIADLVKEFHQDSSFGADEDGYLKVTLEQDAIEKKFMEIVGDRV